MTTKIELINRDLNAAKDTMQENITNILKNNDNLEILVDKTEDLSQKAKIFKTTATKMRKQMCWQNHKVNIIIAIVVIAIITIIILSLHPWTK